MLFIIGWLLIMIAFLWGWHRHHENLRIFDDWDNPSAWKDDEL